jgi:hypothetical protein
MHTVLWCGAALSPARGSGARSPEALSGILDDSELPDAEHRLERADRVSLIVAW